MIFTAQCFFDSHAATASSDSGGINSSNRAQGFMTHSKKALPHCIQAIKLLRERFAAGDEESRKSMTTVGTIASLAALAHAGGDHVSARNHLDGLCGIVRMREGGLKSFDENVKLMVEVLRTDLGVALFHGEGTRFFNGDEDLERHTEFPDMVGLVPRGFLKGRREVMMAVPKAVEKNSDLTRIWTTLREFTDLANYAAGTGKLIPMELYADSMTSTMYRLIAMGQPGHVEAEGREGSNFKKELEVFRVGLLAYACSIFLQWKRMIKGSNHPYPFLAGQFRGAFQNMRKGLEPKLALWLIMVGAVALLDVAGEDEGWVADSLRENMRLCGITEWTGLRGALEEVMWVGLVHDALGKKVMERVASSVMKRVV